MKARGERLAISASGSEGEGNGGRLARARRVFRHWGLRASPFVLGALALCVLFAPWLAPYPPDEYQLRAVHAAPMWYPQCDERRLSPCGVSGILLGREGEVRYFAWGRIIAGGMCLSRVIYGARTSLGLAALALAIGAVLGRRWG